MLITGAGARPETGMPTLFNRMLGQIHHCLLNRSPVDGQDDVPGRTRIGSGWGCTSRSKLSALSAATPPATWSRSTAPACSGSTWARATARLPPRARRHGLADLQQDRRRFGPRRHGRADLVATDGEGVLWLMVVVCCALGVRHRFSLVLGWGVAGARVSFCW